MLFSISALDSSGARCRLQEEHTSRETCASSLLGRGYRIIYLHEKSVFFKKKTDSSALLMELHELVSAGLTVQKSFEIMNQGNKDMGSLIDGIRRGEKVSAVLSTSGLIGVTEAVILAAGEDAGNFPEALKTARDFALSVRTIKTKVISMLYYPLFLLVLMTAAGIFMLFGVLPRITALFAELDISLPRSTRTAIEIISFISQYKFTILIYRTIYSVREQLFFKILSVPIAGNFLRHHYQLMLLHPLALLFSRGLNVRQIINSIKQINAAPLRHFTADLEKLVSSGVKISEAFKNSPLFTRRQKELTAISEEAGNFGQMIEHLARTNDAEYEQSIKGLMSLLEPLLIAIIGAFLLIFIVLFILPMVAVDIG